MVWDVIAAKGDTLHVIDATARRRTVLSADYKTVRSDLLPGTIYRAELLDNGKLILNGTVRTRDGFGRPLHIYDPTNRSINSFGELEGQADATSEVLRQIAVGNGDLFWTSMGGRYVLQQWNGQGRLVKQLTRSVSWFPLPSRPFDGKTPPPPRVTDVTIDSNGLLWASVSVPAADWRNHLKSYYDPNRKQRMYRTSNAAWNTVIEVINPRTATVVASKRYRGRNLGFASPNQIVFYTTDNVGRGSVAIWRLGLSKL
ncbi:MAG TPA: hypothetical protein VK864_08705, partial [Longimicrobiales bacterium]|nr:hypothetical protein [Longimicrobiales bacterium]